MQVNIECKKCGSDKFEIPARPTNSSKTTCDKCGAVETYGSIMKAATDKIAKDLKRKLGKMFKYSDSRIQWAEQVFGAFNACLKIKLSM
ncbi:ECs_2282 family putative zinc-binding protein [Pseudomonas fulva]|uniref:ECs_2282 family putative zinc-binding protein n=1 Tax=Pseudomonas fulva TaxID=47880 RepID=UPI003D05ABD7